MGQALFANHRHQLNSTAVCPNDRLKLHALVDTPRSSQADSNSSFRKRHGTRTRRGLSLYSSDWQRALAATYCASAIDDASRSYFNGGMDNVNNT